MRVLPMEEVHGVLSGQEPGPYVVVNSYIGPQKVRHLAVLGSNVTLCDRDVDASLKPLGSQYWDSKTDCQPCRVIQEMRA